MVNPNEAPEGYISVQYIGSCRDCAFDVLESCEAIGVSCSPYRRDDGENVYFIPKEEPKEMSHVDTQPVSSIIPGISLRDYFAGCALTGLLVDTSLSQAAVVTFAYEAADAMLGHREKSLNGGDNATAN